MVDARSDPPYFVYFLLGFTIGSSFNGSLIGAESWFFALWRSLARDYFPSKA